MIIAVKNTVQAAVKLKPEKIQAETGFEPMTSATPVQCSTKSAIKPIGSWWHCSFAQSFVMVKIQVNIWNIIHLNCGVRNEDKIDHRSLWAAVESIIFLRSSVYDILYIQLYLHRNQLITSPAHLVEHCTGIAEVISMNPVQAWNLLRL